MARFGHQIADGTEHLGEEAKARVIAARRRAIEAASSIPSLSEGADMAADYYDRQPLVFGALALALGAAIGSAIPRTRTEDAYLGGASDDLYHEAERIFAEERAKAERAVSKTVEEVQNVVFEAKSELDRKAEGDGTAAETIEEKGKSAATRIAETAKAAAREEKLGEPNL
jgi:hypothetical protein